MKRAKITFYMDATDEDDSTGLSSEDFEIVSRTLSSIGADDIEYELVDEDMPEYTPGRRKPKKG